MYSNQDLASVYQFVRSTPEKHLKSMLVDQKMTENHFRILLKIARSCTEAQFIEHTLKGDFPKVKFSIQEMPLREHFWPLCFNKLETCGLLTKEQQKAA